MSRSPKPPAYLLHKPSGQARVRINGKDHYLGPHGSPESKDRWQNLPAAAIETPFRHRCLANRPWRPLSHASSHLSLNNAYGHLADIP
jgi:hypothetical protein